jgi:predicted nuclease of predicted toxin-antitoxin system
LRVKLDENLGPSIAEIFLRAGHDVLLTREQGLGGREDSVLIEVCRAEDRCLVTLDLDFGHVLNYPPGRYPGIAILRFAEPMSQPELLAAARTLVAAFEQREIRRKLWIVASHRVREYWEERDTDD